MTEDQNPIDSKALDSLSVAPAEDEADTDTRSLPQHDAGQDSSIAERLQRDPANEDAKLDAGVDESMDASDPPASSQPGTGTTPPASSGYDPEEERRLRDAKK